MKRLLLTFFIALLPAFALAEGGISTGYLAQTELPAGTIVSLKPNPGIVTPANLANIADLLGVVSSSSAISLTSEAGDVRVVSAGTTTTLVSNISGDIRVGDKITVGRLSGIGVKAGTSGKILGTAQASLSSSSPGVKLETLTDTAGKKHQVAIGQIPVIIGITTLSDDRVQKSIVPQTVQSFANQLAMRDVAPTAIIIALALLVLGLGLGGVLLNGAIKGGMLSLGRNPLARQNVFSGMIQVILLAAGIILLTSGLAYGAVLLIP